MPAFSAASLMPGAADVSVSVMTMASTPAAMSLFTWLSCLEISVCVPITRAGRAALTEEEKAWQEYSGAVNAVLHFA